MTREVNSNVDVFRHIDMGPNDACWEWKGRVNEKDGRPYFTVNGKRRPAYVIVLELHTGQKKPKSQMARHSCDNPICCNPFHLSWGSHQDNMNDMKERERHGLPRIVVRAILRLRAEGRTQKEVADLYGVSRETISAIDTGRSHRGNGEDSEAGTDDEQITLDMSEPD
jgi:DNA-binding XRE family transcriptional regulator